jgi:hypothetical protein
MARKVYDELVNKPYRKLQVEQMPIIGKRQFHPTLTAKNFYEIILLKEGSHKWIKIGLINPRL